MAFCPITSWQIDGETMETVTGFIFLGSEITEDGGYNDEIKKWLLLGIKAMTIIDSILENRDIADRGSSSQSHGFSNSHMWMWELGIGRLSAKELMILNCGVEKDSWESLRLQGNQISQS